MRRSELEHLIRAAGRIASERELIVIGSQSVLGQFPDAPVAATLFARIKGTNIDSAQRKGVRGRIERDFPAKSRK